MMQKSNRVMSIRNKSEFQNAQNKKFQNKVKGKKSKKTTKTTNYDNNTEFTQLIGFDLDKDDFGQDLYQEEIQRVIDLQEQEKFQQQKIEDEYKKQFVMTDEDYQDPGQLSNSSGNFQMYPQSMQESMADGKMGRFAIEPEPIPEPKTVEERTQEIFDKVEKGELSQEEANDMITKLFEEETPREDPVAKSAIPGRIMTQTSSGMGDESGSSGFPRHSANPPKMAKKGSTQSSLPKSHQYSIEDLEKLTQDRFESLESLISWFPECRILRVTQNEIYILDSKRSKIMLIDKEKLIQSLFELEPRDYPINTATESNQISTYEPVYNNNFLKNSIQAKPAQPHGGVDQSYPYNQPKPKAKDFMEIGAEPASLKTTQIQQPSVQNPQNTNAAGMLNSFYSGFNKFGNKITSSAPSQNPMTLHSLNPESNKSPLTLNSTDKSVIQGRFKPIKENEEFSDPNPMMPLPKLPEDTGFNLEEVNIEEQMRIMEQFRKSEEEEKVVNKKSKKPGKFVLNNMRNANRKQTKTVQKSHIPINIQNFSYAPIDSAPKDVEAKYVSYGKPAGSKKAKDSPKEGFKLTVEIPDGVEGKNRDAQKITVKRVVDNFALPSPEKIMGEKNGGDVKQQAVEEVKEQEVEEKRQETQEQQKVEEKGIRQKEEDKEIKQDIPQRNLVVQDIKVEELKSSENATQEDTVEDKKLTEPDVKPFDFNNLEGMSDMMFEGLESEMDDTPVNKLAPSDSKVENSRSQLYKSSFPQIDTSGIIDKIQDSMLKSKVGDLISQLQQELKNSQIELEKKNKSLEQLGKSGYNPLDMGNSKLHFAFLFASPLVRDVNGKLRDIMQLDWNSEIEDILDSLKQLNYNLNYQINVATRENLRRTVIDCPMALHFSGHGVENSVENLGQYSILTKEKGNVLLLEDSIGKTNYYFEKELEDLVKVRENKFEVVFVSSCHSEFAGKVFLNAGAKHVICIRQSEKISDAASLKFSSVFYENLFGKGMSVCDAYITSKQEVSNELNNTEAEKFLLFTQETHGDRQGKKHKCSAIQNLSEGTLTDLIDEPLFDYVPNKVECFMCRELEMYKITKLISTSRIVTIIGPPGIGKTSISRNLSNFYKERRMFRDGIIYIKLRGITSAQMFLTQFSLCIRAAAGDIDEEMLQNDKDLHEPIMKKHYSAVEDKQDEALELLKNKQVLIVLDNCEDPIDNDHEDFVYELERILEVCSKVKVLLTSRKPLNELVHNEEKIFNLFPLPRQATIKLLFQKLEEIRKISVEEIKELIDCNIPEGSRMGQHLNLRHNQESSQLLNQDHENLLNHPFIGLLGGHPQAISLIVPLLRDSTLKDLFLTFCDSNMIDVVHENSVLRSQTTSLRVSLELSISSLREKDQEALELFCLIGMLPSGANKDEINQIWGDHSWQKLKNTLIGSSLLIHRNNEDQSDIYYMLPFMSERACEILEEHPDLKKQFHLKC